MKFLTSLVFGTITSQHTLYFFSLHFLKITEVILSHFDSGNRKESSSDLWIVLILEKLNLFFLRSTLDDGAEIPNGELERKVESG